jgi:N-acyl-D-aspartate/D-glutamate deacylase
MAQRKQSLLDCVIALQLEGDRSKQGGVKLRAFSMDEHDVELFVKQPWCAGSTDGWIVLPGTAVGPLKYVNTNRRCFGSFPRRLAHFVRDQHSDTLEEQVRKCSGLPAEILNLRDRGRIAPGYKADLALIDLANLTDHTTFLEPNEYATGIDYVFVNGVAVIDAGSRTLALPGRVLEPAGRSVKAAAAP